MLTSTVDDLELKTCINILKWLIYCCILKEFIYQNQKSKIKKQISYKKNVLSYHCSIETLQWMIIAISQECINQMTSTQMLTSLRSTRFSLQFLRIIILFYVCYQCVYSEHTSFECIIASKQKRIFVHFRCIFLSI